MKKVIIIGIIGLFLLGIITLNRQTTTKDICSNNNYSKEYVSYNTDSNIYHDLNCDCAKRCTVNCIIVTRNEAEKRGGRACHRCHGGL